MELDEKDVQALIQASGVAMPQSKRAAPTQNMP